MTKKDQIVLWLFGIVAITTAFALVASMAHMLTAFGWANHEAMAWVLAIVTVLMNAVFVMLNSICRDKPVRIAIIAGMIILFIVEFAGNAISGGLLALNVMPQQMTELFFGLDRLTLVWIGTGLFAAFLPLINFLAVYATSEAGMRLLDRTNQPVQANPWAQMVLKIHEKSQEAEESEEINK